MTVLLFWQCWILITEKIDINKLISEISVSWGWEKDIAGCPRGWVNPRLKSIWSSYLLTKYPSLEAVTVRDTGRDNSSFNYQNKIFQADTAVIWSHCTRYIIIYYIFNTFDTYNIFWWKSCLLFQVSYNAFVSARNDVALDVGHVLDTCRQRNTCAACHKTVLSGSVAVVAPKLGPFVVFHPSCFTCHTCKELLVDLTYCVHQDLLYCERHYAEKIKPRCATCDELIFSGTYTKAMGRDWHSNHFSCWHCDTKLTGHKYVLTDQRPTCISCYETHFASNCQTCGKLIGLESRDMSYKVKFYHQSFFQSYLKHLSGSALAWVVFPVWQVWCQLGQPVIRCHPEKHSLSGMLWSRHEF